MSEYKPGKRGKLGEVLCVRGLLHPLQLERALWLQVNTSPMKRLGRILIENKMVKANDLYSALCHQRNLPETVL